MQRGVGDSFRLVEITLEERYDRLDLAQAAVTVALFHHRREGPQLRDCVVDGDAVGIDQRQPEPHEVSLPPRLRVAGRDQLTGDSPPERDVVGMGEAQVGIHAHRS